MIAELGYINMNAIVNISKLIPFTGHKLTLDSLVDLIKTKTAGAAILAVSYSTESDSFARW